MPEFYQTDRKGVMLMAMGLGRVLLVVGLAIAALGLVTIAADRFGIRIGRLPGDVVVRGKNSTFYFPLVTCLILSVLASLVVWFLRR